MRTQAGVGLRFPHYDAWLEDKPQVGFLEVHSENFFCGGYHLDVLQQLARHYPVSLHCVGLSLGSPEQVDADHLHKLATLVERVKPVLVSDHLSWSRQGNVHLGDLLPLPYTQETLQSVCDNTMRVQDALGRCILVENPSTYLTFKDSTMQEIEFVLQVLERCGCQLLLDINNIYVQHYNHELDCQAYIDALAPQQVGEIHLAGPLQQQAPSGESLLIDTHSTRVMDEVWALYGEALNHLGPVPTLIEWDKDIPELSVLLEEADKANRYLEKVSGNKEQAYVMG